MQNVVPCSLHKCTDVWKEESILNMMKQVLPKRRQISTDYVPSHPRRHYCLFIYLFICGLFNDAVSSLDYTESNGWMISE